MRDILGRMLAAVACAMIAFAPPPARPAHGQGSNPDPDARDAVRALAEGELLLDLVPEPIAPDAFRALARDLGIGADGAEAVEAQLREYAARTSGPHEAARRAVRGRIAAAYRPATASGALEEVPNPELSRLLAESARWRASLAAADALAIRRLGLMRGGDAAKSAGLALHARCVARDDLPASDPSAALRLPDLLDRSGLQGADRRRAEDALEPHWIAVAEAISARRAAVADAWAERARLQEAWGPAWQVTAPEATVTERVRQLDRIEDRIRAAEAPLGEANRRAAAALLRALAPEAADRVREAVDRALWPWLFDEQRALARSAREAAALGGPPLAEPVEAMLHELDVRLGASRRDLGRRAQRVGELQAALVPEGPPDPDAAIALVDARLRLHALAAKRRKLVHDAALRIRQACASEPKAGPMLDDLIAALDAAQRAAEWESRGLEARLDELHAPAPPGEPASDGEPGGPAPSPGAP